MSGQRTWVSVEVLAVTESGSSIALRRRDDGVCLPGVELDLNSGETVDLAARRAVKEQLNGRPIRGFEAEPVLTVSDTDRDLFGHTVSIVCTMRVGNVSASETVDLAHKLPEQMLYGHRDLSRRAASIAASRMFDDPKVAQSLFGRDGCVATEVASVHHLFATVSRRVDDLTHTAVLRRMEKSGTFARAGKKATGANPAVLYRIVTR